MHLRVIDGIRHRETARKGPLKDIDHIRHRREYLKRETIGFGIETECSIPVKTVLTFNEVKFDRKLPV